MIPASGSIPAAPPDLSRRRRRGPLAVVGSTAVLVACLLAARVGLFDEPTTVDLTLVNPTPYAVIVSVSDEDAESWLTVGRLGPGVSRTVHHVLDQGDRWTIRFHGQGRFGGELQRRGEELRADGWRIEVPPEVAARLEAQGAPASPEDRSGDASGPGSEREG